MPSWVGKVVLVTGAGQACGRAIAEVEATGGTATFIQADVSVESEVAGLVDTAVRTYGRLDVAVNNAGTELPMTIADSDAADFAAVFATNLEGMREAEASSTCPRSPATSPLRPATVSTARRREASTP